MLYTAPSHLTDGRTLVCGTQSLQWAGVLTHRGSRTAAALRPHPRHAADRGCTGQWVPSPAARHGPAKVNVIVLVIVIVIFVKFVSFVTFVVIKSPLSLAAAFNRLPADQRL
jgi:hypothetical protein